MTSLMTSVNIRNELAVFHINNAIALENISRIGRNPRQVNKKLLKTGCYGSLIDRFPKMEARL
jgi:hypothetical protein